MIGLYKYSQDLQETVPEIPKNPFAIKKDRTRIKKGLQNFAVYIHIIQCLILIVFLFMLVDLFGKFQVFYLQEIRIFSDNMDITKNAGKNLNDLNGRHFLSLPLTKIKERLLSDNRIEVVHAKFRFFPLILEINLKQREFWAVIEKEGTPQNFMDTNGTLFSPQYNLQSDLIPIRLRLDGSISRTVCLENINKLHPILKDFLNIKNYNVYPSGIIADAEGRYVLISRRRLSGNSLKKIREKFKEGLLEHIPKDNHIDLRFRGQILTRRIMPYDQS